MKSSKSILFAIIAIVILVTAFAACSAATDEPVAENTSMEDTTASTTAESTTTTTAVDTTGTTTKTDLTKTTTKNTTTTTKKASENKQTKETTSKSQLKEKTTQKKNEQTQEKINPAEIQSEINAYIASKGWEVNAALTPSNAGYNGPISIHQSKSKIIADLKYDVDEFPPSFGKYCYFDGEFFYILYD